MILDTNIIIDYLRDKAAAVTWFEGLKTKPAISVITISELRAGVRKEEEEALNEFLRGVEIFPISQEIANKAGEYLNKYQKSHGVRLGDALIAATAEIKRKKLVTLNKKHFPMLEDILVPYSI